MLRIERSANGQVVFTLSGEVQTEDIEHFQQLLVVETPVQRMAPRPSATQNCTGPAVLPNYLVVVQHIVVVLPLEFFVGCRGFSQDPKSRVIEHIDQSPVRVS
jgi:hypothetical protein